MKNHPSLHLAPDAGSTLSAAPSSPAPAPTPSPAPAPTPAKADAPAKPAPSSAPSSASTATDDDDPFAELDKRFGRTPEPAKPKEGDEPTTPPKAEPAKPVIAPKAEPQRVEPKALRARLDELTNENKTAKEALAAAQAKLDAAEARGKETQALQDRLAQREKEYEATQAELRALKQEATPEFKEKYEKPFNRAAAMAQTDIEQLEVAQEDGTTRKATWQDFVAIYQLPLNQASKQIRAAFGDDAQFVLNHFMELKRLDGLRAEGLKEEKENWKAKQDAATAQQAQQREQFQSLRDKTFREVESSHPEWFGEDPKDPEGNALLLEGRKAVAMQPKTPQQAVKLHARIFHQASAFPREAARRQKAEARVAELEAQIAELKRSSPGPGRRTGTGTEGEKSFMDEFRELKGKL